MARTFVTGVSLAVLALCAACGRNDAGEAEAAAAADLGGEVQTADLAPEPEPEPEPAPAPAEARPLNLDLGSEYADITVTLPPQAADDPALYERLHSQAESEAAEARQIAAEDRAARQEIDAPFHNHTLDIAWSAEFANDETLSLLKTTYVFQGGAHPNAYFDTLNWRRDMHAEFDVEDMLTEGAWAALSPAAEEALMEEKREKLGDGLTDEEYWREDVIYATAPAAENFALFTLVPSAADGLKAGGIALHYAPYAVGPYVEGDYHIVIPQSVFAQYVAPEFADMFAGEPAPN